MTLSEIPHRTAAIVDSVRDLVRDDVISRRLREIGFVHGERIEVLAVGPVASEPLLVQIGYTRFALRRSEAARVQLVAGGGVE